MLNDLHIRNKKLRMLVPTDFSGSAVNAAAYAIQLFNKKTSELILENVFQAPKEKAGTLISIGDILLKESKSLLEKERKHLAAEFRNINISIDSEEGTILNTIKNALRRKDINLLVVGIPKRAANLHGVPGAFIEQPHYWPMLTVPQSALKNISKEIVVIISEDANQKSAILVEDYLKSIDLADNKTHHINFPYRESSEKLGKQIEAFIKKNKIGLIVFNTTRGDRLQKALSSHELDSSLLSHPALLIQHNGS